MKNRYRVYQIDSFTQEKLTGNPAGVVTNADGLSDLQMQKIARELNNSETAFLFRPDDDTYDVKVRFFYAYQRSPDLRSCDNRRALRKSSGKSFRNYEGTAKDRCRHPSCRHYTGE